MPCSHTVVENVYAPEDTTYGLATDDVDTLAVSYGYVMTLITPLPDVCTSYDDVVVPYVECTVGSASLKVDVQTPDIQTPDILLSCHTKERPAK